MIPTWMVSLLSTTSVGEFSYNDRYKVSIKGDFVDGEWVVDVHVYALPYFAWGCNKFHTKIKGSFKMVVGYYLALILNQLSEYGADGRKELIPIMRSYLG